MGVGVTRIEQEFILTAVADKHMPVRLHGARKEAEGAFVSVSDAEIEVELPTSAIFRPDEKVRVFFSYFGHVMTFVSYVKRVSEAKLVLAYPKGVYKHLQRKYERVAATPEIAVSFELESTKVELKFPKSENYWNEEAPVASERFNPESIGELVRTFRQSVASRATDAKIVMFRDRGPEGIEETTIVRTSRILYIPSTQERFPDSDDELPGRIVTRELISVPAQEPGGGERDVAVLLAEKFEAGIYAEIYCPVLFQQYVVGYVYLISRDPEKRFDAVLLRYVQEFARVLAYSLRINNYFEGVPPGPEVFEPRIVDLSASGLLFSHNSMKLKESLMIYADLMLHIQIGNRRMAAGSRVMRKYEDKNACYYGVQYLEMKPEDFRFLFEFVYGRKMTKEDDELWEGGAAPPPLEL